MAGIKDAFSRGLTSFNVKTNEFVEESKINTHISSLNDEIQSLQAIVGAIVYEQWKRGNFDFNALEAILREIDDKNERIAEQKRSLNELHSQTKQILGQSPEELGFCPRCGNKNNVGNIFCTVCGTRLKNNNT